MNNNQVKEVALPSEENVLTNVSSDEKIDSENLSTPREVSSHESTDVTATTKKRKSPDPDTDKDASAIVAVQVDEKKTDVLDPDTADAKSDKPSSANPALPRWIREKMIGKVLGSITEINADIIVNAANGSLRHGGGIAGFLRKAIPGLQEESTRLVKQYGKVKVGSVAVTSGGDVAKYVVHAVGPRIPYGEKPVQAEEQQLFNCVYRSVMKAHELKQKRIAIPAISTGIFNFPLVLACDIIVQACIQALTALPEDTTVRRVVLVDILKPTVEQFTAALIRQIRAAKEKVKREAADSLKKAAESPSATVKD